VNFGAGKVGFECMFYAVFLVIVVLYPILSAYLHCKWCLLSFFAVYFLASGDSSFWSVVKTYLSFNISSLSGKINAEFTVKV
jgi:hypothetical protein